MVRGGIVFIDEFDSNLHDVYLCALLEYLMEYGEGQLCFTTHNVGPMDVLKQHKKSIDFLSEDHQIYPWKTNGNYSPSKLYRNGMIEGSPFNVDAIDFIGVFGTGEEDEYWGGSLFLLLRRTKNVSPTGCISRTRLSIFMRLIEHR